MEQYLCSNPSHDQQKIKYVCVDPICQSSKKIGCADCFLEDHITHHRKIIPLFKEQLTAEISQINQVEFQRLSDSPQKDLEKQIDGELDICLDCIKQRFTTIKADLKALIEVDMQKLQENCLTFGQNMKNEVDPVENMVDKNLPQMEQSELQQMIRFHQEAAKIHKHYTKAAELLQDEKCKIRQKKQKYLGKLRNNLSLLLREFNELMTTKNILYEDCDFETPQKMAMSPNKMINLVETARSSRRFPMSASKKYVVAPCKRLE